MLSPLSIFVHHFAGGHIPKIYRGLPLELLYAILNAGSAYVLLSEMVEG